MGTLYRVLSIETSHIWVMADCENGLSAKMGDYGETCLVVYTNFF